MPPRRPRLAFAGLANNGMIDLAGTSVRRIEDVTMSLTRFGDTIDATGLARASIAAGKGNDRVTGSAGADLLDGDAGNDVIVGGTGRDTLLGGSGADLFVFDDGTSGATTADADVIRDLLRTQGDRIDLSLVDADTRTAGDQAFRFVGAAAFGRTAGELHLETVGGATFLAGETDGDGLGDFYVRLDANPPIVAADLVL